MVWAIQRASSSESFGFLAFTCKYCKYLWGDSTDGGAADTVSDIGKVDIFFMAKKTDLVNIALSDGKDFSRKLSEMGELNLSHHQMNNLCTNEGIKEENVSW